MDLAIDNHVLHCIVAPADRAAFLASVRRVLRSGGLFFSATMSREGPFKPETVNADPATCIARNGSRVWIDAATLERELATAGLRVVSRRLTDPDAKTGGQEPHPVAS